MVTRRSRSLLPIAVLCAAAVLSSTASAAPTWTQIASGAPTPRSSPVSAYDPVSGMVVLFGGYQYTATGGVVYLNDTWTFDGAAWTKVATRTAPPVRTAASLTYDAATKRLVLFGGYDGNFRLGDTWTFDGARSKWTRERPKTSPRPMTGPMGFQDPATGHAYVWGGYDGRFYQNTTWRWTGRTWEIVPTAHTPPARGYGIVGLDPVRKEVVIFAGLADVNPNNTWIWNGSDWVDRTPAIQPPLRYYSAAAYDPGAGGVVIFGGGAGLGDTWVWNGIDWTELIPASSPQPRESHVMTYDDAIGHPILMGGEDATTQYDDTWEFTTAP